MVSLSTTTHDIFSKNFSTEEEVTWFLENVCTNEWNEHQDAGRPFAEAIQERSAKFPGYEPAIHAWFNRWPETISGPIHETVEPLSRIREKPYRLYALTNWSAETFPWARHTFEFLHWFEGIVVSGEEKTLKPRPEFFQILFDRYQVNPHTSLFIDDNMNNVVAARALGVDTIHFNNPLQLRKELIDRNILTRI